MCINLEKHEITIRFSNLGVSTNYR